MYICQSTLYSVHVYQRWMRIIKLSWKHSEGFDPSPFKNNSKQQHYKNHSSTVFVYKVVSTDNVTLFSVILLCGLITFSVFYEHKYQCSFKLQSKKIKMNKFESLKLAGNSKWRKSTFTSAFFFFLTIGRHIMPSQHVLNNNSNTDLLYYFLWNCFIGAFMPTASQYVTMVRTKF